MKFLLFLALLFHSHIFGLKTKYNNYKEEENNIAILSLNYCENNESKKYKEFLEELGVLIDNIDSNKIKALIITNENIDKYFLPGYENINSNNKTKNETKFLRKKENNILKKIESLPILVISALNGLSFDFIFEISLYCDIRICSENTIFGFIEMKKGIIPRIDTIQRLIGIVGQGMGKQIIYTGQYIDAKEAFRIKIVSDICPKNELINSAKKYVFKKKFSKYNNILTFYIRIKYETNLEEKIYIYGNNTDFGNWKKPKFELNWSKGHIWTVNYTMLKSDNCLEFKFVCHSNSYDKWEKGDNRLLCPRNLNGLNKTSDGKYILDFIWNHFKITFNIHYTPPNKDTYMQISGSPKSLTKWQYGNTNPIKMDLDNNKQLKAKDGNIIKGFWTKTIIMKMDDMSNFNFEYRYSLFDEFKKSAMWEREPNRQLHIFTKEHELKKYLNGDENNNNNNLNINSYYLLTNSFLEILDVNFVSDLLYNKIGEKNIFIGPYPQSKKDFKKLYENGINTILNLQSDKDYKIRQINYRFQIDEAKKYNISIKRYPIEDFNQKDLYYKLKGASDLLNKLIKEGKIVYVHCTAGMSRAAATVIMYLVLYENYSVEEADNFCKKYRPIICPNYKVINKIASEYKPGSENKGVELYNFDD